MDRTGSSPFIKPHADLPENGFRLLRSAAAFGFLNALLSAEIHYARMEWGSLLRISPEAFLLLLAMVLLVRKGQPARPLVYAAGAACVVLLKLFQAADRLVPMVFNRSLNLVMDLQRLPDLILLLWLTRPAEQVLGGGAAAAAGIAVLAWGVWRALLSLHHGLAAGAPARLSLRLPVAALSMAVLAAAAAGARPEFLAAPVFPRVAEEARFILSLPRIKGQHRAQLSQATQRALQTSGDLRRLERVSVFLMVVESYGMSAFSDPRHAPTVLPAARAVEAELRAGGLAACSAYLTAPTFGGGSWLSHATLASGVRIDSQIAHDLLLASRLVPLADYFNRAGYRTARVMPGTLWPWPEGGFYRYDQAFIAPDFGYRGPAFGFAPMPDQFVLDWMARRILPDGSAPLFVETILTGSHAAFDIQAPTIEDWDRIGDGSVFHALAPVTFPVEWTELSAASPAYSAAIARELLLLKDFILRFLDRNALVIIVGDHQPCVELIGHDQPWSVPVHVISANPDFIGEFMRRGYTPGLVPMQPPPHRGLETLFWDLIEGFSSAAAATASGN